MMMKKITIGDVIKILEEVAPLELAQQYDNVGLIVGDSEREIESALVCVDVTERVMQEAIELGVGIIISHHPLIFHPIKGLTGSNYVERIVESAIRENIAIYASHTNLDAMEGGLSHKLADILGIKDREVIEKSEKNPLVGFGVVGRIDKPMEVGAFMQDLKRRLNLNTIRHSRLDVVEQIERVAVCSGSGASLIERAAEMGADIYIAADFKYNDFIGADGRLVVADVGHFESEYYAIELIYDIIRKKMPIFVVHKSEKAENPVNYLT